MFGFFKRTQIAQVTTPAAPRGSIWSTDVPDPEGRALLTTTMADRMEHLRKLADRYRAPSGETMDEGDTNGNGESNLKQGYAYQDDTVAEALMIWYGKQSFIGHQLCAILAQHWLIDKACRMPARDAVRNGYEIVSADGDKLDPARLKLIKRWDRKFKLDQHLEQFVHMGRVFGVRIVIFKVRSTDPDYYEKPFNPDGITPGSYKGMVQVDPYWCSPLLDGNASAQPDTLHFYEPTWWIINGKKYHRSHLVIFRNGELADILKPMYMYGGVPVPQRIMERVYAAERTANEGPQLAMSKRSTVFYTDVAKALGNLIKFSSAMAQWREWLDNFGVKVADKTDDKVEQFDTALGDLDAVIMNQYQLVAAGANVIATKLLGTSPKGFNDGGDYETAVYHEELESIQTNDMTPLIERHHLMVDRSIVVPMTKTAPLETTASWNPLDTPTEAEWADINLKKAQTDQALSNTGTGVGAIDQYDIRARLINDPDSGYTTMAPVERPDPIDLEPDPDPTDLVGGGVPGSFPQSTNGAAAQHAPALPNN